MLLEMARAGMAREADALAAVLSAPGVRKAPQVVALAAAIAQDPAIVQSTLQSSGAHPRPRAAAIRPKGLPGINAHVAAFG